MSNVAALRLPMAQAYKAVRDATLCNDEITNAEKIAVLELIKHEVLCDVQAEIDCSS